MSTSQRGFTLLELLVSLSMLVVILVIMLGALRLAGRSVTAGERKMEEQERFRAVLSIMDAQIQSLLPLKEDTEKGKRFSFRGDGASLRFATSRSIRGGREGYVVVEYRIEEGSDGKAHLRVRESVPGIEGDVDTRLIEADRMWFEYFHRDAADEKGQWLDAMKDGTALPRQIRFLVASGGKERTELFPIRIQGRMSAVAGGTGP
ncbi:MAG: hypothetical protein CVU61_14295 [Deltaproteobacteria bacterium HGW-Deltaproteobacteria-19]|jgi:general secretion pathway protein J|nr:MAG: hypothetical protein CVU61_14295 [Deltaproteobacteria bacterium HGW-Deltaproteobacteria-19]